MGFGRPPWRRARAERGTIVIGLGSGGAKRATCAFRTDASRMSCWFAVLCCHRCRAARPFKEAHHAAACNSLFLSRIWSDAIIAHLRKKDAGCEDFTCQALAAPQSRHSVWNRAVCGVTSIMPPLNVSAWPNASPSSSSGCNCLHRGASRSDRAPLHTDRARFSSLPGRTARECQGRGRGPF